MLYLNPRAAAKWFGIFAFKLMRAVRRGETTLEYRDVEAWVKRQKGAKKQ